MPSVILPGYQWSQSAARYRNTATGKFVARHHVMSLLENQIHTAESRLGNIVSAMADGSLAPGTGQMILRDELRRLTLQNAALGAGGVDQLDFRAYGRAGRQLRDTYARVETLTRGLSDGTVTLPQALNRIRGYTGEARLQFFQAERDALRATGRRYQERRFLGVSEHCADCVRYAAMGWVDMGILPVPGTGSICSSHCRCSLERREVTLERTTA